MKLILFSIFCVTFLEFLNAAIFQDSFDDLGRSQTSWQNVSYSAGRSGNAAHFIGNGQGGSTLSEVTLPIQKIAGKTITVKAWIKAKEVSTPPASHNGIKLLVRYSTPTMKKFPQARIASGTFDWKEAIVTTTIPSDATNVTLMIGLEQVQGKAWFDDIEVSILDNESPIFPAQKEVVAPGAMKKWGPYRGMNINRDLNRRDFEALAGTGAKIVRINFAFQPLMDKTPPFAFNENSFEILDRSLGYCKEFGLSAIIDPHSYPGTKKSYTMFPDDEFWNDFSWHELLIKLWREIASRYKDNPTVIGFDLLNEPAIRYDGTKGGPSDYNLLVEKLVRSIREIDKTHTLLVATPVVFLGDGRILSRLQGIEYLNPPIDDKMVYEPHMYEPNEFTHWGLSEAQTQSPSYPGDIGGIRWDKDHIEKVFAPVIRYSKRYNVPIFIGEFSAVRWSGDDGINYFRDILSVFEREGWSWCYHSWRAADPWNAEMSGNRQDTNQYGQTPRLDFLKSSFLPNGRIRSQ